MKPAWKRKNLLRIMVKIMIKKFYLTIKYILMGGGIALLLYYLSSIECKELIQQDIEAYLRNSSERKSLLELLFEESRRPFRNVLYYRFQQDGCNRKLLKACCFFIRPLLTIEINGEIGGGLKIIHNYCVVSVKKAGKNLTVLQGVTIGKDIRGKRPTIGDNVIIFPNSVAFGEIYIGDNATIGAGSLINKDIPNGSVAVGNPFRILNDKSK